MQYELLCGEYAGWFVQTEAWGRAPFLKTCLASQPSRLKFGHLVEEDFPYVKGCNEAKSPPPRGHSAID